MATSKRTTRDCLREKEKKLQINLVLPSLLKSSPCKMFTEDLAGQPPLSSKMSAEGEGEVYVGRGEG